MTAQFTIGIEEEFQIKEQENESQDVARSILIFGLRVSNQACHWE